MKSKKLQHKSLFEHYKWKKYELYFPVSFILYKTYIDAAEKSRRAPFIHIFCMPLDARTKLSRLKMFSHLRIRSEYEIRIYMRCVLSQSQAWWRVNVNWSLDLIMLIVDNDTVFCWFIIGYIVEYIMLLKLRIVCKYYM